MEGYDCPNDVVVKKEYPDDTDCQIVASEEPAMRIKEENEDCGEEVSVATDKYCEVKMEEYDWDDPVSGLGSTAINDSYRRLMAGDPRGPWLSRTLPSQDLNMEYVSGQIPYAEGDVTSDSPSPGSRVKPYFCNFCDYRTHKTSALAQHVRTHTGEKPFSCHLCDFRSSTSGSLKRHVRRHTGEKPYPCNECDYRGTSASDLQVHMRTHDAAKAFTCDMCDYRSTTSWNLREHIKTHTGDKPFFCHLCDFKCSASGSLKRHVRRHTGEKPFSCDVCNYRCSCSSDLKVHRLIHLHTENKPFACKICDWRGVTNGQLKIHTKSHAKPEFYECSVCGLRTGRINNLRNHMRTHSKRKPAKEDPGKDELQGGKPYACEFCDYEAVSGSELSVHEATHGKNPSTFHSEKNCASKMDKDAPVETQEPTCDTGSDEEWEDGTATSTAELIDPPPTVPAANQVS